MKVRKISIKSNSSKYRASSTDQRLIKSVVNNLATNLQELTTSFRKSQNLYLKSKNNTFME